MNPVSKKLGLQPDILDGATIVKTYGDEYVIVENYKSIIEYTGEIVKLQGRHVKVSVIGENLCIESFDPDECRVVGRICAINLDRFS